MRITTAFLRDVLDSYHREEISFSRMVEMINEEARREPDGTEAFNAGRNGEAFKEFIHRYEVARSGCIYDGKVCDNNGNEVV